jgi:exopolysaccharide production protein ExoQ
VLDIQTLIEKGFTFLTIVLLAGFMGVLMVGVFGIPPDSASGGNPIEQALWSGIYLVTFFFILLNYKRVLYAVTSNEIMWLLIGLLVALTLLSTLWSQDPGTTVRNSIALAGTTLFGGYLAACYSRKEQLRMLAWALSIMAVLSLLYIVLGPSGGVATDPEGGVGMSGVFGHKQALGKSMALAAMVFIILAATARSHRWLPWVGSAVALVLVLLSDSKGALVLLLIFVPLWPMYKALRWRYTAAVPFLIAAVLLGSGAAVLLFLNAEPVLAALGKNPTLTGRTIVWSAVLDMIRERPWLGYGYSAFWRGSEGPSALIPLITGADFSNAHNAILSVWLDLGVLGVSIFLLCVSWAILRAIKCARFTRTADGLWPLTYLTFYTLNGVMEASSPQENDIMWVLFVAVALTPITQRGGNGKIASGPGFARKSPARTGKKAWTVG